MAKIKHAVIVTGDRNWADGEAIGRVMGACPEGTLFIHGNAIGADFWCDEMCSQMGYPRMRVPYFGHLGRAGGPVRNQYMLEVLLALQSVGAEVKVFAFHDDFSRSKGTKDMVNRAKGAKVLVKRFRHGQS